MEFERLGDLDAALDAELAELRLQTELMKAECRRAGIDFTRIPLESSRGWD